MNVNSTFIKAYSRKERAYYVLKSAAQYALVQIDLYRGKLTPQGATKVMEKLTEALAMDDEMEPCIHGDVNCQECKGGRP